MNEIQYNRMCEDAELGRVIADNVKAIFDDLGAKTMADLQRSHYKYTDAGVSISFQLHDGTNVWIGDEKARTIVAPWNWIRRVGVSSIVEGGDAEVPLQWIDAAADEFGDEGGDKAFRKAFNTLVDEVNYEACALWDEAHPDEV